MDVHLHVKMQIIICSDFSDFIYVVFVSEIKFQYLPNLAEICV